MKDAYEQFIMINSLHLISYLKKMAQSQFTRGIYKSQLLKCTNLSKFAIFQILSKIGISRDREHFLPWPKNLGYKIWNIVLMTIKPYKIWILLKLKLKNGNQKIARVGYVKFTLIEKVFFKKAKKPKLFFTEHCIQVKMSCCSQQ